MGIVEEIVQEKKELEQDISILYSQLLSAENTIRELQNELKDLKAQSKGSQAYLLGYRDALSDNLID